jgi:hypothetical protein
MEIGRVNEQHARHRDSRGRGSECCDRDAVLESPDQFLQHKDRRRSVH